MRELQRLALNLIRRWSSCFSVAYQSLLMPLPSNYSGGPFHGVTAYLNVHPEGS
jgi:hypothetical protein